MARRARLPAGLVAAVAWVAVLVPAGTMASRTTANTLDLGVLHALNEIRAEHGLHPLALSPELDAAALAHTRDMLSRGYFAHESPDGQTFWSRIRRFYPQARFHYWAVGENLFWTSGSPSANAGTAAWMASPDHRANILDPGWQQVGIAAVTSDHAPGTFADLDVTVITADFGVRR